MVMQKMNVSVIALIMAISTFASAQSDGTSSVLSDKDIEVVHFADMTYPAAAQFSASDSEGIVVVRDRLDSTGDVVEATALSGNDTLVADTLANAKKWRFKPNATKSAIIVYRFQFARGICKQPSDYLTIDAPNLVTLTACRPSKSDAIVLNKPRKSFAEATKILVSDNEMQLQDFAEIDYPVAWEARIQGVVVVEAKLDEKGSVSDASALFGNPILIPDCLANVKKWSFSPNAKHLAVVVYRFKMPCACLNNAPEGQHQFILQPPNYVEVSHAPMWIQ